MGFWLLDPVRRRIFTTMQTFRSIAGVFLLLAGLWGASAVSDIRAEDRAGDLPTLSQLSRPPLDTLDAERTRIWFTINRVNPCLVTVNVLDDSSRVVRRLVDQLLSPGICNIYWAKKNDSGAYVAPGEYRFRLNDCGKRSGGRLSVRYSDWERDFLLVESPDSGNSGIAFELTRDSALVSAAVLNQRGRLIDEPITDSLMHRGRHVFEWVPPRPGYVGVFVVHLTVGDYTREAKIHLTRKSR